MVALLQESCDPLIIQPASLDIATVKKKADDEWVSHSCLLMNVMHK